MKTINSLLLIFGLFLISVNLISQEPCDAECCPNGPQHTFEGSTGALPPFGTITNGGWEANQGTPSYETMDGCDGSSTSVEIKDYGTPDEAIFTSSGVAGPNILFEENKTYCIQLCVKAKQLTPIFEVYADGSLIQTINVSSTNWTTVQFNWTATSNITSFSIRVTPLEAIGLFDNVCFSEVTPENGCMADFSIEQFECGIVCLNDESCGEYNPNVTWTAFNASTNQTINPNQENPCLSLYDGSWFIQLIIKCSDGTTSTKNTTITVTGSPNPQITCPPNQTITAGNSSPCEAEYIMPTITHTSGTFECFINGIPVTAGTAYFLPEGVNNVYCVLTDECNEEEECLYQITVECGMDEQDSLCGEAVISCFSNNTFGTSNPNGFVLGIVHNKDWATAPLGANWTAASSSIYHHSSWTAANLGEIFGLAIDNKDFIYATTTSLYGKNLGGPAGQGGIYKINPVSGAITNFVSTGPYNTSGTGNTIPNDGAGLGNICYDSDNDLFYVTNFYDGYIYQISNTGIVQDRFEPFPGGTTSSSPTFIELGHRPWGIAYNPIDKRLYFSNWVSIRSAPSNGPTTIHSVGVSGGIFNTTSLMHEITLSMYNPTDMPISDIAVSTDGKLLMSNKAAYADYATSAHTGSLWAHIGAVYEYENVGPWQLTPGHGFNPKYNVGATGRFDAAGGVDYGYESIDNLSKPQFCDASVWATGDYLHSGLSNIYYGLQGMPNTGGYNATSVIIDYDNVVNTYAKASFGDVEIFKCGCYVSDVDCDSLMVMSRPLECIDPYVGNDIQFCTFEYLPVCGCDGNTYSNACHAERDGVTVYIPGECDTVTVPSLDSMCCYMIDLKNNWGTDIIELEAQLLGSEWIYNNVNLYPPFSFGSCGSFNQKFCLKESGGGPIPNGTTFSAARVCFTPLVSNPTSDPQIKFTWKELVNETDTVGICMDTLTFECLPKPPLPCLEIINKEAICDPEDPMFYDLCFNVVNNSGVEVCDLTLECVDPGFCFDPFCRINTIVTLPSPLPDGGTSSQICIKIETLIPITSPQDICLKMGLVACDGTECCHDPVKICFPIEPCCDPCEDRGVTFNSVNIDENECCYSVDITNDCLIDYFVGLRLKVQTPGVCIGTHLMNPIHSPNWTTAFSPTAVTFTPISGFLDQTSYTDLFTFCLDKIDNASQAFPTVVLEWLYVNPVTGQIEVACENPFTTECEPIVNDSCLAVIEQDIKCLEEPDKYQYDFTVINQSKFSACKLHVKIIDPSSGYVVTPGPIITFTTPLPTGGSENVSVCFQGTPFPTTASNFVIEYRLQGCDPNDCCRESVRDTIPIPPCDDCCDITDEEFCAQFEDIITPTNDDPCEPCFDFGILDSCSTIGISIDGQPFISPELEESCFSFTPGTHTICFDYKRWEGGIVTEESCMQKDTCLTFVCDIDSTTCLACPAGFAPGQDLISNGNFSGGYTGWGSGYNIVTNTGVITGTGDVSIRNSTNLQNGQWCGLDHTNAATLGDFLTINGPSTSVAYQANVNVQPNTDYVFCMWVANIVCTSTNSTPIIEIHIDGNTVVTGIPIPQVNFQWNLITFSWNSGSLTGIIPIQVFDIDNTSFNDWAIDDVSFVECVLEDSCCDDEEEFCAQFEDIITPTNDDPCEPCFDFGILDSCSTIGISIDGQPFISPELEESCFSFTPGTHTICFDYKRWEGGIVTEESCMQKDTCLTFVCDIDSTTCLACPAGFAPGQDLISNGNFSGGYTGWGSGYNIVTNTGVITGTGDVSIRNSTNLQNGQWCGLDHTNAATLGDFLTINGPSTSVAYQANVNVQPNTDYVFCMWVANIVCTSTNSTPIIEIHIDGNTVVTGIPIPQVNFQWNLITFSWNSGSLTGIIPIQVFDIDNTSFNDWAIDDVSFVECVLEDSCCDDEEEFCAQFEDIITPTNDDPCEPCFDFGILDSCSTIGISIDGQPFISPELEESCFSFTPGTHTICFDYKRWEGGIVTEEACMQKDTCLTFVCDIDSTTCLACPAGSAPGQDLISNGNFSGGYTGWGSGYNIVTNTGVITGTGDVSIRNSTNLQNGQWCGLDHTNAATLGDFLTINGPSTSVAYQANVNVQPNTDYVFCMWVANIVCTSTNSTPIIEIHIDGNTVVTGIPIPQVNFQWNLITFSWNSGSLTGIIPIQVFDIDNTSFNDWAIDDVSFVECVLEDSCCDDEEEFNDLVDLGFEIVYNDNCTVEVCANQFDSCHWFWTVGPDWGDGSIVLPTLIPSDPPNNCWTHTYSTSGTYNICINVEEYGDDGEGCWNRQMCTTVEVECPCEPTADCLEIVSTETKDISCDLDECYVNPFCQTWLRDLLTASTNNGCQLLFDYYAFHRATWNGQTVFVGYKAGAPDGGSQDIYTCDGTLIQSCTQTIEEICDPDAGIDIGTDLVDFNKFWDCGDVLPAIEDCGISAICDDDPWCNLWFRNLVQNTQTNCAGGFIYSFDTGLWGTTPVIIFEGAGPPDYGQYTIYTCDGMILQDCQHNGGGGFPCSPDAGINISSDITARTNIWNCGDPIPTLDPDCSIGDYTCVSYCTTVRNNTNPARPIDKIFLSKITGNITVYPDVFNLIPDLQPNMTTVITYTVCGDFDPGDIVKLNIGLEQTTEEWCCLSDEPLCLEAPPCPCPEVEDICELLDISASKINSGDQECCYDININNDYCEDYFKGIVIHLNAPANISSIIANSGWVINQLDPQNAEIYPAGNYIPIGSHTPFTICNNSDSNYNVTISWLVGLPDGTCEEICPEDVVLDNCEGFKCYEFVKDSLDCATNTYCFKIKNVSNPGFDLYSVHLFDLTGSLAFSPIQVNIPSGPLTSGSTSDWICVNYSGVNSGDNVCYKLSAHNQPVGTPPTQCCTDTIEQCFTIEEDCCTPLSCDNLDITATTLTNGDNECCYEINIDNGYCEDHFKGIKIELESNTDISQVIAAAGWNINTLNNKEAEIFYTGGDIPLGTHTPFTICNTSNSDYTVTVSWLILLPDGTCEELCPVDLELEHCDIDPPFTCYEIVEDTIDCTTDTYCFKIRNNSNPGFDIKSIHIYDITPAGTLSPTGRINVGPISTGMTSDWICYTYSGVVVGDDVCFKLTAHNTPVGELPTACCTDTLEQCFTVEGECCTPFSCDDLDITATSITNGDNECCYDINIDNGYCEDYFKGIKIELGSNTDISQVIAAAGWNINTLNNKEAEIFYTGGDIPLGTHTPFTICNTSNSDYTVTVSWLILLPDGTCEELCPVDLELEHCDIDPPFTCYEIVEDSIDCTTDTYCFKIRNNSNPGFDIKSIHIYDITPAGTLSPTGRINVGPISTGMTSDWICYTYSGVVVGDDVCFKLTAHNTPVGELPTACCTDTLEQCFTIPACDDCCTDEDEFCDLVDLGYIMNNDNSILSISFSQFDSCHWFATDGPDWGDGTPVTPGPINAAGDHTWTHTYDTTGMYNICITIFEGSSEDNICWEKQICKMLWIVCEDGEANPCEPTQMQVPTGITPNGDNLNDVLIIRGPDLCTPIDLYIYNRWGQMVWNQKDYDDTWGGTSYNGEQLPDGTYFIILDYSNVPTQRSSNFSFQSYLDIRRE